MVVVDDYDDEQVPLQQSTERHHSIIDRLSRESFLLVRSIQHLTSTTTHSPNLVHHHHHYTTTPPNTLGIPRRSHI